MIAFFEVSERARRYYARTAMLPLATRDWVLDAFVKGASSEAEAQKARIEQLEMELRVAVRKAAETEAQHDRELVKAYRAGVLDATDARLERMRAALSPDAARPTPQDEALTDANAGAHG